MDESAALREAYQNLDARYQVLVGFTRRLLKPVPEQLVGRERVEWVVLVEPDGVAELLGPFSDVELKVIRGALPRLPGAKSDEPNPASS